MCQIKLTATKKLLTFYVICACGRLHLWPKNVDWAASTGGPPKNVDEAPPKNVARPPELWEASECGEASGAVGSPSPEAS